MIALTSLEQEEMTPLALHHGAVACIAKPFLPGVLVQAIRRVERRASVAAEAA